MGVKEAYQRLYRKKGNWFRIKYSAQILFMIVFSYIVYDTLYLINESPKTPQEEFALNHKNVLKGLLFAGVVLLAYSMLTPYVGPFHKPHEGVWRMGAMICVIYLMILTFLSFQEPKFARSLMWYLDSDLGKPVQMDWSPLVDCSLTWENIKKDIDFYYLTHIICWFLISFLVRDPIMLHIWHLSDEVIELSLDHMVPQFIECWWDHLFVDVLFSNLVGIYAGLGLMHFLGIKQYDYCGRKGKKSIREWGIWKCHRMFGGACVFILSGYANFLTGFFLMLGLWLPPPTTIPIIRLVVWMIIGYLAYREIYEDSRTWNTHRRKDNPVEGRYRWMGAGVVLMEGVLSWKFRGDTGELVDVPTPQYIIILWILFILGLLTYYLYLRFKPGHTRKYLEQTEETEMVKKNI